MKKIRTPKNCTAVYIEWIDSIAYTKVWYTPDDILKICRAVTDKMKTVAYLISKNKKMYVLCNSIHLEKGEKVGFANIFQIPTGCVSKIKKLKF